MTNLVIFYGKFFFKSIFNIFLEVQARFFPFDKQFFYVLKLLRTPQSQVQSHHQQEI